MGKKGRWLPLYSGCDLGYCSEFPNPPPPNLAPFGRGRAGGLLPSKADRTLLTVSASPQAKYRTPILSLGREEGSWGNFLGVLELRSPGQGREPLDLEWDNFPPHTHPRAHPHTPPTQNPSPQNRTKEPPPGLQRLPARTLRPSPICPGRLGSSCL